MAKTYVGIDIGSSRLKMAVCSGGAVRRILVEDMPDNLVKEGRLVSPEAMAEFLKKTASKGRIGTRSCAVILPGPAVFTQTISLPAMTRDQLDINLPYEFRDFITQEKDKYFYDYAVTDTIYGEDGQPEEFEYIAAATLKSTVKSYHDMCRKAGFKLEIAIPEEVAYLNMIRGFEAQSGGAVSREYCFIDLGHTATRIHIFKGIKHQATRLIESGVQLLDQAIADEMNIDEHIARLRKHANSAGELASEACKNIYAMISVEVMRAINFYRFNSPENSLKEAFLCGGGAKIAPLVNQIASDINMPIHKINDLLPGAEGLDDVIVSPAAIGATMQ